MSVRKRRSRSSGAKEKTLEKQNKSLRGKIERYLEPKGDMKLGVKAGQWMGVEEGTAFGARVEKKARWP